MNATTRAQRAYNDLKAMGAPVMHLGEGYSGTCLFSLSAEDNQYGEFNYDTGEFEGETIIWADFYGEFGTEYPEVDSRVEKVLKKYKLGYEWYNPAVIEIYDDAY